MVRSHPTAQRRRQLPGGETIILRVTVRVVRGLGVPRAHPHIGEGAWAQSSTSTPRWMKHQR